MVVLLTSFSLFIKNLDVLNFLVFKPKNVLKLFLFSAFYEYIGFKFSKKVLDSAKPYGHVFFTVPKSTILKLQK